MWIFCEKAKIYCDFLEQTMQIYPIVIKRDDILKQASHSIELLKNEPLKEELTAFITGTLHKPDYSSTEEAIITTKLCQIALESTAHGKELPVLFAESE